MFKSLMLLVVKIVLGLLLAGAMAPAVLASLPASARTPLALWVTMALCVLLVVLIGPSGNWGREDRSGS
jgi:hypothetical protein